jgi:hypothetical protein
MYSDAVAVIRVIATSQRRMEARPGDLLDQPW